jgi:tripartite-type tricarboxylate transporter receptor subunit TctC
MVIIPAASPKPTYTQADFAPITNIAATPNIIAVNPAFPAKSGREFLAELKAHPGKYGFATSGKASINHMLGESFQALSGVDITHVPYRGAGPALNDVVAGQVAIIVDQLPSSKAFIDTGKLRLMGVIAPKRLPGYPDVPTFEELGLKGFTDQAWYGIAAPAKVPAPVLAKLADAMRQVMANPDVRARIEKAGASPVGNAPAEYAAQMQAEFNAMKKLIAVRNISLEE